MARAEGYEVTRGAIIGRLIVSAVAVAAALQSTDSVGAGLFPHETSFQHSNDKWWLAAACLTLFYSQDRQWQCSASGLKLRSPFFSGGKTTIKTSSYSLVAMDKILARS